MIVTVASSVHHSFPLGVSSSEQTTATNYPVDFALFFKFAFSLLNPLQIHRDFISKRYEIREIREIKVEPIGAISHTEQIVRFVTHQHASN